MICYSANRISGEMDLLACPLQRNEGRPLPWRCHLQRDAIVNTQLWEKWAEKHSYPFGIPVMNRDEKTGGGIKRAEAESALWFLSFAALLHSLVQPSAFQGRNITSAVVKLHTFLFARIAGGGIFTSDPENMWGLTVKAKTRLVWFYTWQCSTFISMNSTYWGIKVWLWWVVRFQITTHLWIPLTSPSTSKCCHHETHKKHENLSHSMGTKTHQYIMRHAYSFVFINNNSFGEYVYVMLI